MKLCKNQVEPVRDQVQNQPWARVYDQVEDLVQYPIDDQINDHIYLKVRDQVLQPVRWQIQDQFYEQIYELYEVI